jgi:hypothetical protein
VKTFLSHFAYFTPVFFALSLVTDLLIKQVWSPDWFESIATAVITGLIYAVFMSVYQSLRPKEGSENA